MTQCAVSFAHYQYPLNLRHWHHTGAPQYARNTSVYSHGEDSRVYSDGKGGSSSTIVLRMRHV